MKKALFFIALALSATAYADTYVQGHTRRDGTYVQGHMRSDPDGSTTNNYSTQGNANPYTGQVGTVNPYNQGNSGWGQPQQVCGYDRYGNRVCR